MRSLRTEEVIGVLAALGTTLCYGITPVFLRYFTDYLDVWTVNGIRYTVGALFWLPFVIFLVGKGKKGPSPENLSRNVWKDARIPALVNLGGQVLWGLSPYYLEASVIGFVYKLHFLATLLFGFLLIPEERILGRQPAFLLGCFLSLAGVVSIFLHDLAHAGKQPVLGLILCVGATGLFGLYTVSVRLYMKDYPARLSFGVISLYTAVALLFLMFLFGDMSRISAMHSGLWGMLVLSALLGVALAHVMYYRAIHGLGAIISTGLLMATPFVTLSGAWLGLGERIMLLQFAGGATIILGGILLILARTQQI